jgi:hypothetical protein
MPNKDNYDKIASIIPEDQLLQFNASHAESYGSIIRMMSSIQVDGKIHPCTVPGYCYTEVTGSVFEETEDRDGYREIKRCVRAGYADITIYTVDDLKRMARSGQSLTIVSHGARVPIMSTIRPKEFISGPDSCCDNEQRSFNGGCKNCGDPSC